MPTLTCPICSKDFYRKPSHVKAVENSYCSQECSAKAQRNGKIVECHECGEKIYRAQQYLDKYDRFFCSQECASQWRSEEFRGKSHGNWKHGKFAYKNILAEKSDSAECVLCEEGNEYVLVAHHIDEDRSNNDSENLVWLCRNCHHLVHNYQQEKDRLKQVVEHAKN